MQGWISPRHRAIEPNWALSYAAKGRQVALATLFFLGGSAPETGGDGAVASVVSERVELTWRRDGKREGFVLEREATPQLHVIQE